MKIALSLLCISLAVIGGSRICAASEPEGLPPQEIRADQSQAEGIQTEALRTHVEFLASDDLMGRETGEEGIWKAEEYITQAFRDYGLKPVPGQDDLLVGFNLYRNAFSPESTYVSIAVGGRVVRGELGKDLVPFGFSDLGFFHADVIFAGYGITAPEYDYDDYEDLDVEEKVVFILRHEPGENNPNSPFDGTETTHHSLFSTKFENALDHGAVGMILVTDPLNHTADDDFRSRGQLQLEPARRARGRAREEDDEPFLAIHISQRLARNMVVSTGKTLLEIQSAIDKGARPKDFNLGDVIVDLSVDLQEEPETVAARNVVGYLEGSDPALKDEWIVVGAHHDHLGSTRGPGDTIYNGADDNASGVAGVLELARSFAGAAERPRRSFLFVTFSGEEKGLLGSTALVEQGQIPLDRVRFMLNLDMIGRNPRVPMDIIGDGYGTGLREIIESVNEETRVDIALYGSSYMGGSDHHNFYKNDIPFLFFFTGEHEDYHQPGDHADKLQYDRMTDIVRLARGVVFRVANADARTEFVHHLKWMGTRIELAELDGERQAVVTRVEDDSRAMKAGLREGDVILAIDDVGLAAPDDVGRRFREISPGDRFALEVRSGGETRTLSMKRAKVGFMGIAFGPAEDDERQRLGLRPDEGVLVRRVIEGGPSDQAGLRGGDVLVRIEGEPVGYANLRSKLTQIGAGETIDVTVIRDGEWLTTALTLGERPRRN